MYSIKKTNVSRNINEIISLQSQVKASRIQDKLSNHEDMKQFFEAVTDMVKNLSEDVTKTIMETSIENNKALSNSNQKLSEILNVKGRKASDLLSSLS